MTLTSNEPRVRQLDDWAGWPRRFGWLLAAGWVLAVLLGWFVGLHPATYGELVARVSSGEVTEVTFVGDDVGPGATGSAVVDIRWDEGWRTRHVEVRDVSSWQEGVGAGDEEVIRHVRQRLLEVQPGLTIVTHPSRSGIYSSLLGWRVDGALAGLVITLYLGTILVLTLTPAAPWRATRWAWFWLVAMAAPVGIPAFLVLGGPTRLVRPPLVGARPVTGGWAFLLALILGAPMRT